MEISFPSPPLTFLHYPGKKAITSNIVLSPYWSGLPCPPPGDLPHPGMEPRSPTLQADSLPAELPGNPKRIFVLCFQRALQSTEFLRKNKASHTHKKTDILTVCVLTHNWLYHCN